MLTFNEMVPPAIVEVGIKPLSFKKINEYARELRTYGYLKLRPEAGMTIGSLFFDIDRIKTRYNNQFQNSNLSNLQKSMLRQLCHAIKCLWMWKKRSRNKIDLLLSIPVKTAAVKKQALCLNFGCGAAPCVKLCAPMVGISYFFVLSLP